MIFVTVGTHEQQFNRLLQEIDRLKKNKMIEDNVFIQTGYSDYLPKYCDYENFLSYEDMRNYIKNSEVIITHGGPSSFMQVLSYEKTPIVVPRFKKYNEHVNNHQVDFVKKLVAENFNLRLVLDVSTLFNVIQDAKVNTKKFESSNDFFNNQLEEIALNLLGV
ncbi:glycosyltransferase [Vagococcus sp.]|uniref:glycosyltransferase n=1 Tax=Vagococcus sp. TaxID=1933889 RepID=UPI003F9AC12A